jgi:hypothetical protein
MLPEGPPDIFLAHTAALIPSDRESLNRLEARLSGQGYRVYSSLRTPLAGSVMHGLESRIERASVGLLAMNHRYATTAWSCFELGIMSRRRDWMEISLLALGNPSAGSDRSASRKPLRTRSDELIGSHRPL